MTLTQPQLAVPTSIYTQTWLTALLGLQCSHGGRSLLSPFLAGHCYSWKNNTGHGSIKTCLDHFMSFIRGFLKSPMPGPQNIASPWLTGLSLCGLAISQLFGNFSLARRRWAIILVACTWGHHRHFILGFISYGFFSILSSSDMPFRGVLIGNFLVTSCSNNTGNKPKNIL